MKLYLYILGIIYWITEHLLLTIAILLTLIALLCVLLYSCFNIQTYYDIAIVSGMIAVLTWVVIFSSAVSDKIMLCLEPEDEEV